MDREKNYRIMDIKIVDGKNNSSSQTYVIVLKGRAFFPTLKTWTISTLFEMLIQYMWFEIDDVSNKMKNARNCYSENIA